MKIRKEQMSAFSQAAAKSFEERLVAHVQEFFPADCQKLGEQRVREKVRYGIDRAKTYGLVSRNSVCKFVDVMFAFGHDFDGNRKLPWAGEILNDPTIIDPVVRANRLFDAGKANIRQAPRVGRKWAS